MVLLVGESHPAALKVKIKIKITLPPPRIRPKTQVSEGRRQSRASLGTPRGEGGDKKKTKASLTGYLKAIWPDFGGAFLRSGRPRGPGIAFKNVGASPPTFLKAFPGPRASLNTAGVRYGSLCIVVGCSRPALPVCGT